MGESGVRKNFNEITGRSSVKLGFLGQGKEPKTKRKSCWGVVLGCSSPKRSLQGGGKKGSGEKSQGKLGRGQREMDYKKTTWIVKIVTRNRCG